MQNYLLSNNQVFKTSKPRLYNSKNKNNGPKSYVSFHHTSYINISATKKKKSKSKQNFGKFVRFWF